MPQGTTKIKTKLPAGVKQKSGNRRKPSETKLKKGKHVFKAKKSRHVEQARMQAAITKSINKIVEEQVVAQAASVETKTLKVLQTKSAQKNKKQKQS